MKKKVLKTVLLVVLAGSIWGQTGQRCPGNFIGNGGFETGTPPGGTEGIGNGFAPSWSRIWLGTGVSSGEFYLPTVAPPTMTPPAPASGNYASFHCNNDPAAGIGWREGIRNTLTGPIGANTGVYTLDFDLAALAGWGTAELAIYGVNNTPLAFTPTITGFNAPTNPNLFGAANTVLIGRIVVTNTFVTKVLQTLTFNSNAPGFPAQINQIFLTRSDFLNAPNPESITIYGSYYVAVDNFCMRLAEPQQPTNEGAYCCKGANVVQFGNFEAGNTLFTSEYTFNASVSTGATLPGQYNVTNTAGALSTSSLWNVTDHTQCADPSAVNSLFLVANGLTNQPAGSSSVLWEQTVLITDSGEYKFCANFKNLDQCTFNVLPQVSIEMDGTMGPWTIVNAGSGPCDWLTISECYTLPAGNHTMRIHLKEDVLGDGNDLAIDDISLQKKSDQNLSITVMHTGSTNNIQASVHTISNSDDMLAVTCNSLNPYTWIVAEWDPLTNSMIPGTIVTGNSLSAPPWLLTTNFPGYTFTNNVYYSIVLHVPSCCESCFTDGWTRQITFNSRNLSAPDLSPEEKAMLKNITEQSGKEKKSQPGATSTRNMPGSGIASLRILPNPNHGVFTLQLNGVSKGKLEVSDVSGRTVYSKDLSDSSDVHLDLQKEAPGLYNLRFTNEKQVFTEKFIID